MADSPQRGRRRRLQRSHGHGEWEDVGREVGDRIREELAGWAARKRGARKELSEEEKALRDARAAVARRLGFLAHAVPYAIVCTFLLFVAGFRPALITAMAWGIGLSIHGFFAIVAPELRRRWTEEEVRRRVPDAVAHKRLEMEGRHARNLEHLSASIAHEIRNPITAAKSLLQQMGEDPHSPENVEYAAVALQELERVERSISHLLRYARDEDLQPQQVVLAEVVQSALEALQDRVSRTGAMVRVDVAEASALVGDPEKLRRVVLNLVGNALDALEGQHSPAPRVDVEAGENLAGSEVWLRVRDNGAGIPPEKAAEIWTPFRTSKANGTGLGLPIVRKIVEAHGGTVEVDTAPGRGAAFLVTLPRQGLMEAGR